MRLIAAVFSVVFFFLPDLCHAQQKKHTTGTTVTTTITSDTALPATTSGSGKIIIQYINPFHFQYSLQVTSTNITAPTPPGVIAPGSSTGGTLPNRTPQAPAVRPQPGSQPSQPATVDQQWQAILITLKTLRDSAFSYKQQTDILLFAASMEEQCYKGRLSFYSHFLLDENTAGLLAQFATNNRNPVAAGQDDKSASDSCRRSYDSWPYDGLQTTEKQIYALQGSLFDLATAQGFAAWKATSPNGDNYTAVTNLVGSLLTQVQGLESTSAVATNFQAAQVYDSFWRSRVEEIARSVDQISSAGVALHQSDNALKSSPKDPVVQAAYAKAQSAYAAALQRSVLVFSINVDCSTNWYGRGRTDTVSLHYLDVSASSPTDQSTQIAINTCYTPATVSTGIGMSFLRNTQYGFVSGRDPANPTNTISVIGATTDQLVTPIYALQYNIAVKDFKNGLGFHASVGAALGSSSGTANIEPIAGPSISIRHRAFFITPAFQMGRRDQLLPGYKIGDSQGNGLTSVPVNTSWKPGFALIFSFSVAQ